MQPEPTGRVIRTGEQAYDLILTRRLNLPPGLIWPSFSESERASAWIGRWDGSPGPGRNIDFQMLYEDGKPQSRARITECIPRELLRAQVQVGEEAWELEVRLNHDGGGTLLEFVQHLQDPGPAESIGPGWEYYLDRLTADLDGGPAPDFGNYYPGQALHYETQARTAASGAVRGQHQD